jgi:membrane protease subunit (stomatin/prohibitin family)
MAGVATGVTLASVASRESVSKEEAEEMMDDLVEEGTLRKETRNGETVYVTATSVQAPAQVQSTARVDPMTSVASTKFCRQCGTKIPGESKFCEKCGAQL